VPARHPVFRFDLGSNGKSAHVQHEAKQPPSGRSEKKTNCIKTRNMQRPVQNHSPMERRNVARRADLSVRLSAIDIENYALCR
jgi:hypothetical protein